MQLTPTSVELLAPAGNWDAMEAAVKAGADAVYLGGKHFNMRMHRADANFDDTMLAKAVAYCHNHKVRLYVTVNNLVSTQELEPMQAYLTYLNEIKPDALIVQDLAILQMAKTIGSNIPLHASVMMNTHNEFAVRALQDYGITRVVLSREMMLSQLALLKERTGIEMEYFIHGDMCVSFSGQCLQSGILFGQSSNRGRCLKPCRWPYQLIDEGSGDMVVGRNSGSYKLAIKDMCMYRNLPDLIQAGVCSFKIEGRMRTADFVHGIVSVYRRAIDRYIADPTGYQIDADDWRELQASRSRDFSTCYALGNPGSTSIGYDGSREPRFFSQAVIESDMDTRPVIPDAPALALLPARPLSLAVRVANLPSLVAACQNGANAVYIGGEAFKPAQPWTLADIRVAIATAAPYNTKVIVTTPRVTMERECGELEQLFLALEHLRPHGIMVSNAGALRLAYQVTSLPIVADFSFNIFNQLALQWLKSQRVTLATPALEATYSQVAALMQNSNLPLEFIVHGPLEAMIMDHCLLRATYSGSSGNDMCPGFCSEHNYALLDSANQQHPVRIDQYCRNHILFAKDLCLLPYLRTLSAIGIGHFRLEGQHYPADYIARLTAIYRRELDQLATSQQTYSFAAEHLEELTAYAPREMGIGVFRHRTSR